MRIVLASESPSRRRALDILGIVYEVRPSHIDEKAIRHDDPYQLTRLLSETKAMKVAEDVRDAIIVAGDAVVSKAGKIYEKPTSPAEAREFLREFSGSSIEFVTAIAVLNSVSGRLLASVQCSKISFRTLLESEIADHVRRYDVLTFAGAINCVGVVRFAEHVSGSCNFATGLAINELIVLLRQQGLKM
jgi:septum formation protein